MYRNSVEIAGVGGEAADLAERPAPAVTAAHSFARATRSFARATPPSLPPVASPPPPRRSTVSAIATARSFTPLLRRPSHRRRSQLRPRRSGIPVVPATYSFARAAPSS